MPEESFPGRGPDAEEPDGSAPLPGGGNEDEGLFLCLPAGRADLSGFTACTGTPIAPGPLLAGVAEDGSRR